MTRSLLIAFCTLLGASGSLSSVAVAASQATVSLDDVVLLARSDISDQTIFTFLDFREPDFVLDAETLRWLRESGVSEAVIRYLLEIEEVASSTPSPTSTVRTAYSATTYPAYYYGSRRIGSAVYPLGFYDHRYFGLGYTIVDGHGPHYSGGHNSGFAAGIVGGHGSNVSHRPILGGHQNNSIHDVSHGSSTRSHATRRIGTHTARHTRTHTSRHTGGHSSGHRGGHGRGH